MIELILVAATLGLGAGISPGPLLALLVSETIQSGLKSGCKVAMVPLWTDLPIILLVYYLFLNLQDQKIIIAIISFCGGCFLLKMSWDIIFPGQVLSEQSVDNQQTLKKAILTNILSPYPYLFWLTIGLPVIHRAGEGFPGVLVFVLMFYFMLVGIKLIIAMIVAKTHRVISGSNLNHTYKLLGLVFFIFALLWFKETYDLVVSTS